jgi:hypothetical protein
MCDELTQAALEGVLEDRTSSLEGVREDRTSPAPSRSDTNNGTTNKRGANESNRKLPPTRTTLHCSSSGSGSTDGSSSGSSSGSGGGSCGCDGGVGGGSRDADACAPIVGTLRKGRIGVRVARGRDRGKANANRYRHRHINRGIHRSISMNRNGRIPVQSLGGGNGADCLPPLEMPVDCVPAEFGRDTCIIC